MIAVYSDTDLNYLSLLICVFFKLKKNPGKSKMKAMYLNGLISLTSELSPSN